MDIAPRASARGGRFARTAWILLDWAASGFSTVLITLVVAYVERQVVPRGGWGLPAAVVWAWTMAAAMLASAVIAPLAAAWADRRAAHRLGLLAGTALGAGGLVALAAVPPSAPWAVVAATVAACVGFDLAQVFTGSLLPMIAADRDHDADRLSARGFAAGYAGGAVALVLATGIVTARDRFGLDVAGGLRLAFAFTAAWWIAFSLPAAWARFGRSAGGEAQSAPAVEPSKWWFAATADGGTGTGLLIAVLAGSMLTLGAVQTAISQFSSLALQQFHLDPQALVRLVLLVQAVALPGALAVGWLATRLGRRPATAACMGGWIAVLVLAWLVRTPAQLHALAVLLALVLGGVQSLLRAAVAVLAPPGRTGATFGLLNVGTKLAGCAAGFAFGGLEHATGEPRAGLVALLVQMLAGWWLLRRMR